MIGAILLVAVAAGWWTRAPEVELGGDEATYIMLSRSLEQGRYHDEFRLGTPPHAKYPPGVPLWIALVRRVTGPDLDNLRAANLFLLVLTALLVGDAVRRATGPWPGIAGVALTALSPGLLGSAGTGLSEVPFTCLAAASLWVTSLPGSDQRRGRIGAAVGLACASFLTRSVGLSVIAGVIAWLVIRRRWRAAGVSLACSTLLVGGWFLYAALVATGAEGGSSYAVDFRQVASTGGGGLAGLFEQVATNTTEYLSWLPIALAVPSLPGTLLDNVVWLVLLGSAASVGVISLLRRWPAAGIHLLTTCFLLAIWPWPVGRLLIPLMPFVGVAILVGSFVLAGKAGSRVPMFAPLALGCLLAAWGARVYLHDDTNHQCDRQNPYGAPGCLTAEFRNAVSAFRFIRDSAPPGVVVATGKPATVFFFSGHQTIPLPRALPAAGASEPPEGGPDRYPWIVLTFLSPREQSAARRWLESGCEGFRVRKQSPGALVLTPETATSGSEEDACGALREFLLASPG